MSRPDMYANQTGDAPAACTSRYRVADELRDVPTYRARVQRVSQNHPDRRPHPTGAPTHLSLPCRAGRRDAAIIQLLRNSATARAVGKSLEYLANDTRLLWIDFELRADLRRLAVLVALGRM